MKWTRRKPSEDRSIIPTQRLWLLCVVTTGQLWMALSSVTLSLDPSGNQSNVTLYGSFVCAVLAVFGLRSIPVRRVIRSLTLVSGLILAAFGLTGALGGVSGTWRVLVWLVLTGVVLTLAPSSRSVVTSTPRVVVARSDIPKVRPDPMSVGAQAYGAGSPGVRARRPLSIWVREGRTRSLIAHWELILSAALLLGASALLLGPYIANRFPAGLSAGDLIDRALDNPSNIMAARSTLDMRTRPSLTDKVVLSVRSPLAMFWRTETFDHWDGQIWSRKFQANGEWITNNRALKPSPDDLGALRGTSSRQEFRLETGFATALPSGSSPVKVRSSKQLARRDDGTLVSPLSPLGRGATYTVESRQLPLDYEMVSDAGSAGDAQWMNDPVVRKVLNQFAEDPVTTERVRRLARSVTKGARTDFQRVTSIEEWLGRNTVYSTDAPVAQLGVDTVDDFLFESKEGWCEQIATSLVVMARELGIPARLVTGFVPGEWDAVSGRFTVRERDAHAWAEVWFPEIGWVPFDPTSAVPLAGSKEALAGADASDWREQAGLLLLIAGVVLFVVGTLSGRFRRLIIRVWRRLTGRSAKRKVLRKKDLSSLAVRLEKIGRARGRRIRIDETMTKYSEQLAELVGDPDIVRVGIAIDREVYRTRDDSGSGVGSVDEFRAGPGPGSEPGSEPGSTAWSDDQLTVELGRILASHGKQGRSARWKTGTVPG